MLERFHHAVIAVRDLARAVDVFRDDLGLDARLGGRHAGRGTHNAIVRFGVDYVELQGVFDPQAEIAATGLRGQVFVDFLAQRAGGLVGYCLEPDDVDAYAEAARRNGLEATGPVAVQRRLPTGGVLSWRVLLPGGVNWRRPWPFFIRADQTDAELLAVEQPGHHALGAMGVRGIAVAVRDLGAAQHLYERQLGLARAGEDRVADLAARRVSYRLGAFRIDLLAPAGPGAIAQELDAVGEGPFQLTLGVRDLAQARDLLAGQGIVLSPAPEAAGRWLIPPERACGARLVLEADG